MAKNRLIKMASGHEYVIQTGIPVTKNTISKQKYPFKHMLSGESFEIKTSTKDMKRQVSRISSACSTYVKRCCKNSKFIVRRTGPETIRVWRIK